MRWLALLLVGCTPIDDSAVLLPAPSIEAAPRGYEAPEDIEAQVETVAVPSVLDPCTLAPAGGAFPVSVPCGLVEVNDPALGSPLPALVEGRCGAPGNWVTYAPESRLSVYVQFCGVGQVIAYTDEGHCFGVASSTDGDWWGAHVLPGMTVAVSGDRFAVDTAHCL